MPDTEFKDGGSVDYVIVGGGSAGCVLAGRLSEDPACRVCLVEAGPRDRNPLIHIPAALFALMRHRNLNWRFETVPQHRMDGASVYIPRGRALGGSSAINGMVYVRGHRDDYEEWAATGLAGWGWDGVLPYFLKSERNECFGDDALHGQGGPLTVTFIDRPNPLGDVFVAAAESLQFRHNRDFNGAEQEGFGVHQVTQKNGRRCSAATAFLTPALRRRNLEVLTGRRVTRVIVEKRRAVGIALTGPAGTEEIRVRHEIILSAGAIASPHLLMLSGIGSGETLARLGIPVVHDLPEVGRNLQDHAAARSDFDNSTTAAYGLSLRSLPRMAWSVAEYALARRGFWASNLIESGGFVRTDPTCSRPDIQLVFVPGQRGKNGRPFGWGHGFSITAVLLRPKSRGSVTPASPDPEAAPAIDPAFFSGEGDLETLTAGFRLARRLIRAPAFDAHRGRERLPGPEIGDGADLADWVRRNSATIFHPVGTCRMGVDPASVVDPELRVRGVDGLRVVDASVMPTIVGGNTNAPTIMIGEKAADMIKASARAGGMRSVA